MHFNEVLRTKCLEITTLIPWNRISGLFASGEIRGMRKDDLNTLSLPPPPTLYLVNLTRHSFHIVCLFITTQRRQQQEGVFICEKLHLELIRQPVDANYS